MTVEPEVKRETFDRYVLCEEMVNDGEFRLTILVDGDDKTEGIAKDVIEVGGVLFSSEAL